MQVKGFEMMRLVLADYDLADLTLGKKKKKVSTNGVKLQSPDCQVFYLPPTLVASQYFWNNMNNIGKRCQTSVGLI